MSSNMLSKEEFQTMSDWLYSQATFKQSRHSHDIKCFIGLEPGSDEFYEASKEVIKSLTNNAIRNLYNLNRLAQVTRYGDIYDRTDENEFIPKNNYLANERIVIETLISLRYQCSEYMTRETKYWDSLNQLIGSLCENIFSRNERVR